MLQVFCGIAAIVAFIFWMGCLFKKHQKQVFFNAAWALTFILLGLWAFGVLEYSDIKGDFNGLSVYGSLLVVVVIICLWVYGRKFENAQKKDSYNAKGLSDIGSDIPAVEASCEENEIHEDSIVKEMSEENKVNVIEKEQLLASDKQFNQAPIIGVDIPAKLKVNGALNIFNKAIQAGLITVENNRYKWNLTIESLGYLCGKIYCGDIADYDQNKESYYLEKTGEIQFPNKELNTLFGEKNIGQTRRNSFCTGNPLNKAEVEEINKLFEQL